MWVILVLFVSSNYVFTLTARYHIKAWFPQGQCFPGEKNAQIVGYKNEEIILKTCDNIDCRNEKCHTSFKEKLKYNKFSSNIFSDIVGLQNYWSLRYLDLVEDPPNVKKGQFAIVGFADEKSCLEDNWYGTMYFLYSSADASLLKESCMKAGVNMSFSCSCHANRVNCLKFSNSDCSGKGEVYGYSCESLLRVYCGPYKALHNPHSGLLVDFSFDTYYDVSNKPLFFNNSDQCYVAKIENEDHGKKLFSKKFCQKENSTCSKNCVDVVYQTFKMKENEPAEYDFEHVLLGGEFYAIQNDPLKFTTGEGGVDSLRHLSVGKDTIYTYNDASFMFCQGRSKRECLEDGNVIEYMYDNFACEGEPVTTKMSNSIKCGVLPRFHGDIENNRNWVYYVIGASSFVVLILFYCMCCCCLILCNFLVVCCVACSGVSFNFVRKKRSGYKQIN